MDSTKVTIIYEAAIEEYSKILTSAELHNCSPVGVIKMALEEFIEKDERALKNKDVFADYMKKIFLGQ